MDLVEEILDISNQISALKIKKLFDAISNHIPDMMLPTLGLREGCLNSQACAFELSWQLRSSLRDLASYANDHNSYRNFIRWINRQAWRRILPNAVE